MACYSSEHFYEAEVWQILLPVVVLKSRLPRDQGAAGQIRLSTPLGDSKDGASLLDTTSLCLGLASLASMIIPLLNSKNHCCFPTRTRHKRERLSGLMGNPFRRYTWQGSRVLILAGYVFIFY